MNWWTSWERRELSHQLSVPMVSHAAGGGVLSGSVYKQIERSRVDYWSKGIRCDQAMLSKFLCEVGKEALVAYLERSGRSDIPGRDPEVTHVDDYEKNRTAGVCVNHDTRTNEARSAAFNKFLEGG